MTMICAVNLLPLYITIGTVGAVALLFLVTFTVVFFNLFWQKRRNGTPKNLPEAWIRYRDVIKEGEAWAETVGMREVSIESADKLTLRASYIDNTSDTAVILVHGYTGNRGERLFSAPKYYERGYKILSPDMRAQGKSDGKFITMGVRESEDVLRWIDYLTAQGVKSIILDGISMGGATVLTAVHKVPDCVVATISDCAYTSTAEELLYVVKKNAGTRFLIHGVNLAARCFGRYSFYKDTPIESVRESKVPILFIHGKADSFVSYDFMAELYDACKTKKRMFTVDDAIHAMSEVFDPDGYKNAVTSFLDELGV